MAPIEMVSSMQLRVTTMVTSKDYLISFMNHEIHFVSSQHQPALQFNTVQVTTSYATKASTSSYDQRYQPYCQVTFSIVASYCQNVVLQAQGLEQVRLIGVNLLNYSNLQGDFKTITKWVQHEPEYQLRRLVLAILEAQLHHYFTLSASSAQNRPLFAQCSIDDDN